MARIALIVGVIGWKTKIGLDVRDRRIRKAGRPQKIIEMRINVTPTPIIRSL